MTLPSGDTKDRAQRRFLASLRRTGQLTRAADAARIKHSTVRRWRREDEAFASAYLEALDAAGDFLEAEAVRRAKDGVIKDIYYKGEVVGQEIIYSDSLLQFLLKGWRRAKYGDRLAHTGPGDSTPVEFTLNIPRPGAKEDED